MIPTVSRLLHSVRLLLITLGCLVLSARVGAVSMGDEVVLSLLGDPVEVEIEVLQWDDLDLDQVQIGPGTLSDYENFGLVWQPVLANLRFNLVGPNRDGKVRVLISSADPLDEPYLELLVVMRWPGGSLLREYILLFDPPLSLQTSAGAGEENQPGAQAVARVFVGPEVAAGLPIAAPTAPVAALDTLAVGAQATGVTPANRPAAAGAQAATGTGQSALPGRQGSADRSNIPDFRTTYAVEVETIAPRRAARPGEGQTGRRTHLVQADDSLWTIATQAVPRGEEADWFAYILALIELNGSAFVNNNIALLKQGEQLQLPANADLAKIDRSDARDRFEQRWNTDAFTFTAPVALLPEPVAVQLPDPVAPALDSTPATPAQGDESAPLLMPASNTIVLAVDTPRGAAEPVNTLRSAAPTDGPGRGASEQNQLGEAVAEVVVNPPIAVSPPQISEAAVSSLIQTEPALVAAPEPEAEPVSLTEAEAEPESVAEPEVPAAAFQAPEPVADSSTQIPLEQLAQSLTVNTEPAPAIPLEQAPSPSVQVDSGNVIISKQQRLEELETMVLVMRTHVIDAQDVAARLKTALDMAQARTFPRGNLAPGQGGMLLNVFAGVLLLGLVVATGLLLRMFAQVNSLYTGQYGRARQALVRKRRPRHNVAGGS